MGDAIKWALLGVAIVVLIGLVVALPFMDFINVGNFAISINAIVAICSDFFRSGRSIINSFLTPYGRVALTGLLAWLFGKWAITVSVKIVAWVYHFIFK